MNLPRAFLHANLVEKMGKKENKKKTGDGEQGIGGAEHDGGVGGRCLLPSSAFCLHRFPQTLNYLFLLPTVFLGKLTPCLRGG